MGGCLQKGWDGKGRRRFGVRDGGVVVRAPTAPEATAAPAAALPPAAAGAAVERRRPRGAYVGSGTAAPPSTEKTWEKEIARKRSNQQDLHLAGTDTDAAARTIRLGPALRRSCSQRRPAGDGRSHWRATTTTNEGGRVGWVRTAAPPSTVNTCGGWSPDRSKWC